LKFVKHPSAAGDRNEAALLAEYRQSGSLDILGRLYEPYMPLVFGLCVKYLKDEAQSKDAVMQIFEQLVEKLRIHQVINFKSWLYTLARNYCLMELRDSGKHQTVSLDDSFVEVQGSSDLQEGELHEGELTLMERCIEKLPEEQRKSIELFYLEQKCYREVADLTGYDINKVKSYIQNGKRNLKICMEKNGGK
jgi:RNA polymerase sigma-70 factor (ECF subfamily)